MVEVVLTSDDLRLADEMNHLYGAKAKEGVSTEFGPYRAVGTFV